MKEYSGITSENKKHIHHLVYLSIGIVVICLVALFIMSKFGLFTPSQKLEFGEEYCRQAFDAYVNMSSVGFLNETINGNTKYGGSVFTDNDIREVLIEYAKLNGSVVVKQCSIVVRSYNDFSAFDSMMQSGYECNGIGMRYGGSLRDGVYVLAKQSKIPEMLKITITGTKHDVALPNDLSMFTPEEQANFTNAYRELPENLSAEAEIDMRGTMRFSNSLIFVNQKFRDDYDKMLTDLNARKCKSLVDVMKG